LIGCLNCTDSGGRAKVGQGIEDGAKEKHAKQTMI